MTDNSLESMELSQAFLQLYEEVKRRFRELGLRGDLQTMEKLQAMLLVFLEKGRPIRPRELVDSLIYNPAFSRCKDARRMVFYVLSRLVKTGVVEKTSYKGSRNHYRLASSFEVKPWAEPKALTLQNPAAKEVLDCWRRLFELRSITKLWRITSLGHALVHELHILREKLRSFEVSEGDILESLDDTVSRLIDAYTGYATTGNISPKEVELFHQLENGIKIITQRSRYLGG